MTTESPASAIFSHVLELQVVQAKVNIYVNVWKVNITSLLCFIDIGESVAIALFDYEAIHDGDLGFKKGDKLRILEE